MGLGQSIRRQREELGMTQDQVDIIDAVLVEED